MKGVPDEIRTWYLQMQAGSIIWVNLLRYVNEIYSPHPPHLQCVPGLFSTGKAAKVWLRLKKE
jgi:hypothetical protein